MKDVESTRLSTIIFITDLEDKEFRIKHLKNGLVHPSISVLVGTRCFTVAESKPLKVAVVIDVYDNATNGAVISTKRFVQLLEHHYSITIVTSGHPQPGRVVLPELRLPLVNGIIKNNNYTFARPQRCVLEECLLKMNLIHVETPFLLGTQAIKIARAGHVPVICTFHVQPENILYNGNIHSELAVRTLYRLFVERCYNRADAVICPSRFAEDELKRFGLRVPSYVVSNGVLPQFKPLRIKREDGFKDKFIILSVGRLARDKRQDVLIRAVARSQYRDRIQLIFAGHGPMKSKLEHLGKALPNTPLFHHLPPQEMIRLYNMSDLYVHPSVIEIEGMSVLEAISCGLPALVSDSEKSASVQFALSEKFIFRKNDPVDLSHKIDYWVEHREELKEYAEKYHLHSRSFTIDKSVVRIDELYRQYARN